MPYAVLFKPSAKAALTKLSRQAQARLIAAAEALAENPRPPGCVKLSGMEAWRIRVGSYRIIYEIEDNRLIVLVLRIP